MGDSVCGCRYGYDSAQVPPAAQQNVSLSAADSVCPFFGILLCLCDQNLLGLGIGR